LALAATHPGGIDAHQKAREVFFAWPEGFTTHSKAMAITAGDGVALALSWRYTGIEPDG